MKIKSSWFYQSRLFYFGMIIPAVIIIIIGILSIKYLVFPIQKEILFEVKKEKIKDLSIFVINRLNYYNLQVLTGKTSLEEAQKEAIAEIEFIRYGEDMHHYFWIHSLDSKMIMHPFHKDLQGKNITDLKSTDDIFIIKEFNKMIEKKGDGYLEYGWKRRYDSDEGSPKISYVIGFKPWKWVVGTGLYFEDLNMIVAQKTQKLIETLIIIFMMLMVPVSFLILILRKRDKLLHAEIKQQTNELKRLAMVANRTHSGVLVMNMAGEIEWANESFTNITGYTVNEVLGKKPSDFLNGENTDPDTILEMRKCLQNKQRVCVELRNYKKNGEELWLNIEVVPILDNDGVVINHIAIEQDITQKLLAEKEKVEMRKKLIHSDKLASIGELAAGVGHEINNPLAIVQGNLDMLSKQYEKDQVFNLRFDKINMAMERIRAIVKGLRSFARNDSEEQEIVDIHDAINDTVALVDMIFEKEKIAIKKNYGSSYSKVIINLGRFQQVIMNLLTNSKDALEGKGGQILISTKNIDNQVCLRIADNGCGIKEEDLGKIFQAFHTTKGVGKGTGLGLSIVSSIINSFDGSITVKSKVNVGTEFEIILPSAECVLDVHKKQKEVNEKTIVSYKGKVLVVDDEEDIREILKSYLEDIGFVVDEAADGVIALEMVKENKYLMVFTDLKMPNMRGDEFIEQVRNKLHDNIPILIVTGCQMSEEKSKTSEIVNNYSSGIIYKPFKKDDIYKMISDTVSKMYKKAA